MMSLGLESIMEIPDDTPSQRKHTQSDEAPRAGAFAGVLLVLWFNP
jgi:hypothetical protein